MEELAFLSEAEVRQVRREFGSPVYVYDQATLVQRAKEMRAFPHAFGLTVRYAMKALPNGAILRLLHAEGLKIDASSGFEAERALLAGIPAADIQITAQELPDNLEALIGQGVGYNACSLRQLEAYGALFPNTEISVRINPGLGSGATNRTNVGGPGSSFGIWHEKLDEVYAVAARYGLKVTGMHTHIGSGSDPEVWVRCAKLSLDIAARMPEVTRFSLGGGYKVARMATEATADIQDIGGRIVPELEAFAQAHQRKLHLEVEPGTYIAANAGAIVSTIRDIVDTGEGGYTFLKTDSGMTDNIRPSMYGAQHPLVVVPAEAADRGAKEYIVSGHCCESGDILTPAPGDPEDLQPRLLTEACPNDLLVIEGSGAYCAAQCARNYNSFPESAELLRTAPGQFKLIRKRQEIAQMIANEVLD